MLTHEEYTRLSSEVRTSMLSDGTLDRHDSAVKYPVSGFEASLVCMVHSWAFYALCFETEHKITIGLDPVMSGPWGVMGDTLLAMLDGDTGRLDVLTLHNFIHATLTDHNIEL